MSNGSEGHKRSAGGAGLYENDAGPPRKQAREDEVFLRPEVESRLQQLYATGKARPEEFDNVALRELSEFESDKAIKAINQLESADLSTIRNKGGFLIGIMTRLRRQAAGPRLPEEIQKRLDVFYRSGKLKATDLDAKIFDMLGGMPSSAACAALDKFATRDLRDIRNVSAFMISIIREAEKRAGSSGSRQQDAYAPPSYAQGSRSAGYAQPGPSYGGFSAAPEPMTSMRAPHLGPPVWQGEEQRLAGVRINEFHGLADVAGYVPAAVALKLQTLWDSGVKLVALLDDSSWETLAELDAPEGLVTVSEVASAMTRPPGLRDVNVYFASCAGKYPRRKSVAALSSYGQGGAAAPQQPPASQYYMPQPAADPLAGFGAPQGYGGGGAGPAAGGYGGGGGGGGPPGGYGGPQQGAAAGPGYSGIAVRQGAGGGGGGSGVPHPSEAYGAPRGNGSVPYGRDNRYGDNNRGASGPRPGGGGGGGGGGGRPGAGRDTGPSMIHTLPESVRRKVESAIAASGGNLNEGHFNGDVCSHMNRLSEHDATEMINELIVNDFSNIRSLPGYIIGMCKRKLKQRGN